MQSLSAIVRCYDLTEAVFERLPQAPLLILEGLRSDSGASLKTKTLFFLRAFLGSDHGTKARAKNFQHAIAAIADGAVVGSAIVSEMAAGKPVPEVLAFVKSLADGAHSA